MDVRAHNRLAWNRQVEDGNRWTKPVDPETIQRARQGNWEVVLTPTRVVPQSWFPEFDQLDLLCLASAGGQQAPILAAAGASVTVLDNSPKQLEQDRFVAQRDGLEIELIEGDMRDLSCFANASFDLIFHPCSNTFVDDVNPVWQECRRVLRPGGTLLSGFTNAVRYIFDDERKENGNLEVRYPLPYSDLDYLSEPHIQAAIASQQPLEFGHTLEDQIGGQLRAGFALTGLFEDRYADAETDPLSKYLATFIATRSVAV